MLAIRGHIDKGLALSVFIAHLAHRRSRDLAMKVLEQGTVDHVYYGVGRAMPTGGWGFIPSMDDVQGDDTPLTILMFMSAPVAS